MSKENILSISFNQKPDIRIRVIDDDDPLIIKEIKKDYPFELFNTVRITVITNKREFWFDVPCGYTWNGADIPKFFYRIIGSRTSNDFLVSSMLHDFLLEFKVYIINECIKEPITIEEYRRLTSLIFREKLKAQGIKTIKANIMSWCVETYQHYFCKSGWNINDKIK